MFKSLYENIGIKIKNLAIGTFIVEAIGAIITGLVLAFSEDVLFIFIAIGGPVTALIFSWFIYAFGELIEDVHSMRITKTKDFCEDVKSKNKKSNITKPDGSKKASPKTKDFCEDVKSKNKKSNITKSDGSKKASPNDASENYSDEQKSSKDFMLNSTGSGYICPICKNNNHSFSSCAICGYVPPVTSSEDYNFEDDFVDSSCSNCGRTVSVLNGETNIVCPWCNSKISID
ncbi:MAG: hypothetical protein IIX27_06070 [Ruminococcus sp.]|nr:hypothetical protein [Ruminococcus sp.]